MKKKNNIYDISAELTEKFGAVGSKSRADAIETAWEEYNAQIILEARRKAHLTQTELANRIGADKSYISRVERGITVPSVATLYKIVAALGLRIELHPT